MPSSLNIWLDMGGYGAFIWPCYGVALVLILFITIISVRSRSKNLDLLKKLDPERSSES